MNHSATGNSPSYTSGTVMHSSAPRPSIGGGIKAPHVGGNPIVGSHSYGSSLSGSLDSGRYNSTNVQPVYCKTDASSGVPRAPVANYGSPLHSSYQQPPPMYANKGSISENEAPTRIIPIAALNPYQGRWRVKARVTAKGDLRHYNNPRGDGKVFSFDLLDSDGGEIRATCFNSVAEQFYGQIDPGKVYMISGGVLKPAQKAFNHLQHDHEITLDANSILQPCLDDDKSIPRQQFHFRPIIDLESSDNNSIVDLIAVVSSIGPSSSVMTKNGTEIQKRTLQLKDMSARIVEFTLWGSFCDAEGQTLQTMSDAGVFPILAVKSCRVNDFSGKSVGTISTSQLFIEPEFPEAQKLKAWFNSEGKSLPAVSISKDRNTIHADARKTISQINDEKLGTSEKPDWISVSATLVFVKVDNFSYPACPRTIGDRQCSKKVTETEDGKWRCERCDESVDECDFRYILQMQIQDHTGLKWVTAFQESGEDIMGISAKDLYYLRYEKQDDEKFLELLRGVLFTRFLFKLKVKEENFSDELRVKSTVIKAEKANFQTETKYLLDWISNFKKPRSAASRMIHGGVSYSNNAAKQCGVSTGQVSPYGYSNRYNEYGGSRFNSTGSTGECYKCHQLGHWARDCPGTSSNMRPGRYGMAPKQQFGGF